MPKQTRTALTRYFQTNSIPTQSNFQDLIDSMINHEDDPIKIDGSVINIFENVLKIERETRHITLTTLTVSGNAKIQQEEWQAASLENSWKNDVAGYNLAGYFKDTQGIVHLRGVLQNALGSEAIGSNLFVLPEGYRPERKEIHAILSGESNALGRIDIFADGGVQFVAGQPDLVSLDGITFRVP